MSYEEWGHGFRPPLVEQAGIRFHFTRIAINMVLNITTADRRCTPRYHLLLLVVLIVLEANELKGSSGGVFHLAVEAKPLIALLQLVSHQKQQQQQLSPAQSRFEQATERQERIGNFRQQLLLLSSQQNQQQQQELTSAGSGGDGDSSGSGRVSDSQELDGNWQDFEWERWGNGNSFRPFPSLTLATPRQQQRFEQQQASPGEITSFPIQKRAFDSSREGTRSWAPLTPTVLAPGNHLAPTSYSSNSNSNNDTTEPQTATLETSNTKEAQQPAPLSVAPPRSGEVATATGVAAAVAVAAEATAAGEPNGSTLRKALLGLQNPRLLGGDIIMTIGGGKRRKDRLIKFERSALVSSVSLWPSGVIFYELDPSVSHLTNLIYKVMQQFHDETCIKFIARKHNEPDYLRIEALKGCFSYVGRIGGEQTLSLGDGCEYRGTIAHELLHAVGFYHHQNRSDRDDFLEILWDNIARGKESQFLKMNPQDNALLNEFDYDSIMLYGPRTFGKTLDKVTMKPKREGVILLEVVEKQGLSLLDIDSVNKLYKCKTSSERSS